MDTGQAKTESARGYRQPVDQTFDLDMSALQRTDTSGSSAPAVHRAPPVLPAAALDPVIWHECFRRRSQGGLDMFGQIFNMGGSSSGSNGDDSTLTVAEVVVSVGQQVSEGDPVPAGRRQCSDLEDELQSNVEKAKRIWRRWKPTRPCQNNSKIHL